MCDLSPSYSSVVSCCLLQVIASAHVDTEKAAAVSNGYVALVYSHLHDNRYIPSSRLVIDTGMHNSVPKFLTMECETSNSHMMNSAQNNRLQFPPYLPFHCGLDKLNFFSPQDSGGVAHPFSLPSTW